MKFKELTNTLSPQEAERWASIKQTYQRNVMLRSIGADDKVAQVILALYQCNDHLAAIHHAMAENVTQLVTSVASNGTGAPSEQAAAPPQAIQIINRVPRALLDIIQWSILPSISPYTASQPVGSAWHAASRGAVGFPDVEVLLHCSPRSC